MENFSNMREPISAQNSPARPSVNNTPEMTAQRQPAAKEQVDFAKLPDGVKLMCCWCVWKYEPRPSGKPAKVPYNPRTGMRADCSNPSTFGRLADVQNYAERGYDGVGVLVGNLSDGSRMVAIDIDKCINVQGSLSPMAADIIRAMGTYTEVSPSGQGIRILLAVPADFTYDSGRYYINNSSIGLEIYDSATTKKYVSVTGKTLTPGAGLELRGNELLAVLEKYSNIT